jgi:hypothetical protein
MVSQHRRKGFVRCLECGDDCVFEGWFVFLEVKSNLLITHAAE